MRILVGAIFLVIFPVLAHGQTANQNKCTVQDLSIDAALGNHDAQYDLGVFFFRGDDVPQDFSKAAIMWRLAANAGMVEAHNNLGFLTYYGKGVKQDYAEGIRLWRQAAEAGFAESQVHLAEANKDERYLIKDLVEAYAWAKAGKHFAEMTQSKLGSRIAENADQVLIDVRAKLSPVQLNEAEKRAATYISKYPPKKPNY
jgi:hypothetical protein